MPTIQSPKWWALRDPARVSGRSCSLLLLLSWSSCSDSWRFRVMSSLADIAKLSASLGRSLSYTSSHLLPCSSLPAATLCGCFLLSSIGQCHSKFGSCLLWGVSHPLVMPFTKARMKNLHLKPSKLDWGGGDKLGRIPLGMATWDFAEKGYINDFKGSQLDLLPYVFRKARNNLFLGNKAVAVLLLKCAVVGGGMPSASLLPEWAVWRKPDTLQQVWQLALCKISL